MDQIKPPTPEKKCESGCCCFSQMSGRGIAKGAMLITLGLVIAIPAMGRFFSQYFHIFLGAGFIAWGLYHLFLKNKNKD